MRCPIIVRRTIYTGSNKTICFTRRPIHSPVDTPNTSLSVAYIQGGSKNKLLVLSEYVNKTEKMGGMRTDTNGYRENEALRDILT